MELLLGVLPYLGSGFFGAALTYGLAYGRERRRSLDAYHAPQRQAIGDIVAATHELMLRELELRTVQTELIQCIRQDRLPGDELTAQLMTGTAAFGKATLDAERAFQIGRLTIVDAPCWEAMGAAYFELSNLRRTMAARVDAPDMQTPEEIEAYVDTIKRLAEQFNHSVLAMVIAAADRVSPAETLRNRRHRDAARGRLGERYRGPSES
ncbi:MULTISPECIES: hypothetical protein [Mycolicibacterium]|uniref:hypothetical protein n=1 Tax=Mycolicibacterium TaxID=1866885 RepID=UPI0007EBB8CC|nr:hypothetical protein [Mycolicibacterium fortuitum]OBG24108.1 hypothetical protein A5768_22325 [Mycolicibacterium fortuitum]